MNYCKYSWHKRSLCHVSNFEFLRQLSVPSLNCTHGVKNMTRQYSGVCTHLNSKMGPQTLYDEPTKLSQFRVLSKNLAPLNSVRRYSDELNENKKRERVRFSRDSSIHGSKNTGENILMPFTFPVYVIPNLKGVYENIVAAYRLRKVDKTLSLLEFLVAAKKALFVIANLLADGNIEELELLFSPEAFKQVKENHVNIPARHRELLGGLHDEDYGIPLRHIHQVRERKGDNGTRVLEIVLLFDGMQKLKPEEHITPFTKRKDRKMICFTARFERVYNQDGTSDAPWLVSGVTFVIKDLDDQTYII